MEACQLGPCSYVPMISMMMKARLTKVQMLHAFISRNTHCDPCSINYFNARWCNIQAWKSELAPCALVRVLSVDMRWMLMVANLLTSGYSGEEGWAWSLIWLPIYCFHLIIVDHPRHLETPYEHNVARQVNKALEMHRTVWSTSYEDPVFDHAWYIPRSFIISNSPW